MVEKKDPGKFTIGFNENDPAHQQVIELLNRQAAAKGSLLSMRYCNYIHCSEPPEIAQAAPLAVDKRMIEEVVLRILKEQRESKGTIQQQGKAKDTPASESIHIEKVENVLGEEGIATIANTLAAFRNK